MMKPVLSATTTGGSMGALKNRPSGTAAMEERPAAAAPKSSDSVFV